MCDECNFGEPCEDEDLITCPNCGFTSDECVIEGIEELRNMIMYKCFNCECKWEVGGKNERN